MRWKWHSPDEIVQKLASVRQRTERGASLADAIREAGVSEATFFRWRAQYGSLDLEQVKQIKQLELENARLRRALQEFEFSANA
jgi:putative transposase